MQTVLRTDPRSGVTRAFAEYSPQEVDAARLQELIASKLAREYRSKPSADEGTTRKLWRRRANAIPQKDAGGINRLLFRLITINTWSLTRTT